VELGTGAGEKRATVAILTAHLPAERLAFDRLMFSLQDMQNIRIITRFRSHN